MASAITCLARRCSTRQAGTRPWRIGVCAAAAPAPACRGEGQGVSKPPSGPQPAHEVSSKGARAIAVVDAPWVHTRTRATPVAAAAAAERCGAPHAQCTLWDRRQKRLNGVGGTSSTSCAWAYHGGDSEGVRAKSKSKPRAALGQPRSARFGFERGEHGERRADAPSRPCLRRPRRCRHSRRPARRSSRHLRRARHSPSSRRPPPAAPTWSFLYQSFCSRSIG